MLSIARRWAALGLTLLLGLSGCDDGGDASADPTDAQLDAVTSAPDGDVSDARAPSDARNSADTSPPLHDAEPDAEPNAPDAEPDATPDPDAVPDAEPLPPPPWPVDAPGPLNVGFHEDTIEYPSPVDGAARPLRLAWWYPTRATEGRAARYGRLLSRPSVFSGAPPHVDAPMPVVVFSHGNGGFAEQSFFLTEYLASHGWIVVAPDHTGNTFLDMSAPIYELFELRPRDIGAVLDHLDALPAEHPLAGAISDARALAGHSFGGYTTLAAGGGEFAVDDILAACVAPRPSEEAACAYTEASADRYREGFGDPRLRALIPMTPAGARFFQGGLAALTAPTLMMTGGRDATLPNEVEGDPLWDAVTHPDAVRLDFPNAGHFTFSDACSLAPNSLPDDGCGPTFLPAAEAHPLINAYALAFLRLHVLGDDSAADLITGPPPQTPEINRTRRADE